MNPEVSGPVQTAPPAEILTIGHSRASVEELVALLKQHEVKMLVDVRARPHNAFVPQFNRDRMKMALLDSGIVYTYLGERLGRVPDGPSFTDREAVDFLQVEKSEPFRQGLDWLVEESRNSRLCLFCGEAEPHGCHRDFLIARNLLTLGVRVLHILPDGRLEPALPDLFHLPPESHGNDPAS